MLQQKYKKPVINIVINVFIIVRYYFCFVISLQQGGYIYIVICQVRKLIFPPNPNVILDIITTHLTAKIPYTLYVCICTANTYIFHPLLCLCQHHLYLVQKERFNIRPLSLFLPFFNIQSFSLWFRKVEHKKAETDNRERGQLIAIYLRNKFLSLVYFSQCFAFYFLLQSNRSSLWSSRKG